MCLGGFVALSGQAAGLWSKFVEFVNCCNFLLGLRLGVKNQNNEPGLKKTHTHWIRFQVEKKQ